MSLQKYFTTGNNYLQPFQRRRMMMKSWAFPHDCGIIGAVSISTIGNSCSIFQDNGWYIISAGFTDTVEPEETLTGNISARITTRLYKTWKSKVIEGGGNFRQCLGFEIIQKMWRSLISADSSAGFWSFKSSWKHQAGVRYQELHDQSVWRVLYVRSGSWADTAARTCETRPLCCKYTSTIDHECRRSAGEESQHSWAVK